VLGSPPTLWARIPLRRCVLDTTLCNNVCQCLRQIGGFLQVLRCPQKYKTDRHDITEILLKVALNTINKPNHQIYIYCCSIFPMWSTIYQLLTIELSINSGKNVFIPILDFCQYGNLTDLPKFIQIFVLFWKNWNQI
jgi:hypothetical protein